jgi:hypothetical protein
MFKDLDQKVDLLAEQGSLFGKKLDHVDQQLHKSHVKKSGKNHDFQEKSDEKSI